MQKVSKVLFVGMNSDDSINGVPPGDYTDARNLISANGGVSDNPLRENVRGTLLRTNADLPDGDNTCIGTFEDRQSNRLIYFLYNSDSNHSIWYFNPETNTHVLVMESEYLGFDINYKITGVGVINDILSYTDSRSPKSFNIQKAIDGYYDTASEDLIQQITLDRVSPMLPPTAVKDADGDVISNNISSDGWQFATRYIYNDNEASLFSPLSKLVLPEVYPTNTDSDNFIVVTQAVQDSIKDVIKRIQFAFVKNGNGEYRIFKDIPAAGLDEYVVNFYNTESALTVEAQATQTINSTPMSANNLALFKERIFTTLDSYDYQDVGSFNLSLEELETSTSVDQIHLPGTSYTYGVVCFDEFGKTNGVISPVSISFSNITAQSNVTVDPVSGMHKNITWTISGTPPSWGKYFSIVRKLNNTISTSCVIPVQALFYKRDSDGSDRDASSEVYDNGQIFHENHQNSWTDNLYLRIPDNTPIAIDSTYKVRILEAKGQTRDAEAILSVKGGNKLVTGNFGITSWSGKSLIFLVRLEKYREEPTELFYEVGQTYTITDSEFDTVTGSVYGDYRRITQVTYGQAFNFNKMNAGDDLYEEHPADILTSDLYWETTVYSQSPTTASASIDTTETSVEREKSRGGLFKKIAGAALSIGGLATGGVVGGVIGGALGGALSGGQSSGPKVTTISDVKRVFALDYTKIISDNGRAFVEVNNKIISREPTTVAYSEKFIPNSKVNGLNLFIDGNNYALSPVRTPIQKLQPVDEVILAIHEKNATSLYIGQSFINNPGGGESLAKTTTVIGDDRHLSGGFGTLHPESVVGHDGKAYWFDAYSGEPLRYNNGLTPIGSVYKMRKYFKEKGDGLVNGYGNVYGGYDPYMDMVYFTFSGGADVIEAGLSSAFEEANFINNAFSSTLDPWLQLDPGTGGASWDYNFAAGLDAARVQPTAFTATDIIYQAISVSGAITVTGSAFNLNTSDVDLEIVFLNNTTIVDTEVITAIGGFFTFSHSTTVPLTTNGIGFRFNNNVANPGGNKRIFSVNVNGTSSTTINIDNSLYQDGDTLRVRFKIDGEVDGAISVIEVENDSQILYNSDLAAGEYAYADFVYNSDDEIIFRKTGSGNATVVADILLLNDEKETIGFIDRQGYERWVCKFDFTPEYYGKINNRLFSFVDGQLWEHNASDTYNNFYGQQYESSITSVFNGLSSKYPADKILRNVSVESNEAWSFDCENPKGQQTDLTASKFVQKESTWYADVLRDRNTNPLLLKVGQVALRSGKEMIDKAFTITIENDSTDLVKLDAINIGFLPFPGQRIN